MRARGACTTGGHYRRALQAGTTGGHGVRTGGGACGPAVGMEAEWNGTLGTTESPFASAYTKGEVLVSMAFAEQGCSDGREHPTPDQRRCPIELFSVERRA